MRPLDRLNRRIGESLAKNMSEAPVIAVENVSKVFYTHHFFQRHDSSEKRVTYRKKRVDAAQGIDFTINKGEVFGLLGPNGAGKTTTVKMLSGLIRPNTGAVYVDGLSVEKKRLLALRKIGVVLEGTRTSIWPLTPMENLAYFGTLKAVPRAVIRERSQRLLEFIGLKDKMNVQVRHLSRGQKQKLAICIALISDPPILLLDEPTTGLDVQSNRSIKDKIIEMTRTQGKSVLVTTHDMHVAQELCDRIGIINEGKLVTCKPTAELLDVFSDFSFEFVLDRPVDVEGIRNILGLQSAEMTTEEELPVLVVGTSSDEALRSQALYQVVRFLEGESIQLRSITQRKQNLESVFLRLTSKEESSVG